MINPFVPQGQYDRVAIMAPGPSLAKWQIDAIMNNGLFTIAVGDAYLMNPFTDILYHCDAKWWEHYNGVPEFMGCDRVSIEVVKDHPEIKQIAQSSDKTGLSRIPTEIVTGGNSGYQAIGLAFHYRPKEIILVGFDLRSAPSGQYNVRGDHPPEIKGRSKGDAKFARFIEKISLLAEPLASEGVTVYNCSIDSALTCFTRKDLLDVL